MKTNVLIQHVSTGLYLLEPGTNILLAGVPGRWTLDATADEVANYTFRSVIHGDFGRVGSATGSLNGQPPIDVALVDSYDFIFSPGQCSRDKTGWSIQVAQGGESLSLNVNGTVPIFGEDDWTDNCLWIVKPY